MISDDLIKVNKLSAKKPKVSDSKRKKRGVSLLNQDLRFSINSESAGETNQEPLKLVQKEMNIIDYEQNPEQAKIEQKSNFIMDEDNNNYGEREGTASFLLDNNSVNTKDKSNPQSILQSPSNQMKVDIMNKSEFSYSYSNQQQYPVLNQQKAYSVNVDDGYSQIAIKNIEFGEEYPKNKDQFRSFKKDEKSPPVIDYQTDLIKKISQLKQLHLNQSVSYQGPTQKPQLRVIHSNIGSVDLENSINSPIIYDNNSQMELRENSFPPDMTMAKRKRSIRKNNSQMNKSIDIVPILGHHDSTGSQARSQSQYNSQEQRERRRLKVIETQFSNQNSLVTLKYQIMNKTMANGFKDHRIQKVLIYDKSNFNQFKNFDGTALNNKSALKNQHSLSRKSNSIEEAPESNRSSSVFNEELFPQLSLNDQAYNKYRSLELRQFISSKLHFHQSNVNFSKNPNNLIQNAQNSLNDYVQLNHNANYTQSRSGSPYKMRFTSQQNRRNHKNNQQEYMDELRKITSSNQVDKPYSVSLLYNNTYDEKAKKIQVPMNILEQFIPPGKELTNINI